MSTIDDEQQNTIKFITQSISKRLRSQHICKYIFFYSFLKCTVF